MIECTEITFDRLGNNKHVKINGIDIPNVVDYYVSPPADDGSRKIDISFIIKDSIAEQFRLSGN